MGKWIKLFLIEKKPKTNVWRIETKESHDILGYIKWFPRWRKYAFFPSEYTVYETDCLMDIVYFLNEQMELRKIERTSLPKS